MRENTTAIATTVIAQEIHAIYNKQHKKGQAGRERERKRATEDIRENELRQQKSTKICARFASMKK